MKYITVLGKESRVQKSNPYKHFLKNLKKINSSGNLSLIHTDAADERTSVDLGGRRIIKKKK